MDTNNFHPSRGSASLEQWERSSEENIHLWELLGNYFRQQGISSDVPHFSNSRFTIISKIYYNKPGDLNQLKDSTRQLSNAILQICLTIISFERWMLILSLTTWAIVWQMSLLCDFRDPPANRPNHLLVFKMGIALGINQQTPTIRSLLLNPRKLLKAYDNRGSLLSLLKSSTSIRTSKLILSFL